MRGPSFGNIIVLVNSTARNVFGANTGSVSGHHRFYLLGDFAVTDKLYGVFNGKTVENDSTAIHVQGNVKVSRVKNFHSLVFELGENLTAEQKDADPSLPMLTLTHNEGLDLSGREIVLANYDGTLPQRLIDFEQDAAPLITDGDSVLRYDTPFMSARYAIEGVKADDLDPAKLADRREVSLKTSTSTLSESFLGTSALIRQGADFIAEVGLRAMTAAADGRAGAVPFAAATGGRSTYETGSRMRLNSVSLVTGAAMKRDSLTAALFFEASRADSVSRSSGNRGDAESTLNDIVPLKLETPTLEGHYGIFEMGALMKPSESSPWSFDLSLKGYAGVREGVAGSASVFYAF